METKYEYKETKVHHEAREAYDEVIKTLVKTTYIANDGKEFTNEYECQKYERNLFWTKFYRLIHDNLLEDKTDYSYDDTNYNQLIRLTKSDLEFIKNGIKIHNYYDGYERNYYLEDNKFDSNDLYFYKEEEHYNDGNGDYTNHCFCSMDIIKEDVNNKSKMVLSLRIRFDKRSKND